MSEKAYQGQDFIRAKKEEADRQFFRRGLSLALFSGISYGLYSVFILLAQQEGVWAGWSTSADQDPLLYTFFLPLLASALNDLFSALWAWLTSLLQGEGADVFRSLFSRAGGILVLAALVGGPMANAAYVIALSLAGPVVTPISALCPAIGAVFGRLFFKQEIRPHMAGGIALCLLASLLIGWESLAGGQGSSTAVGILFALLAALGWGIEGVIGGFASVMVDPQVGITIRQSVSGLAHLFLAIPLLAAVKGVSFSRLQPYFSAALTDGRSLFFFAISAFFAYASYSRWYKGNSMCGSALGMACNGTYSFFGPFFSWLILGQLMGQEGYQLSGISWLSALLMAAGIFLIAVDPAQLLKKKKGGQK